MENTEVLLLVVCGLILVAGVVCLILDKRVRSSYNGALGLISGLIFASGLCAVLGSPLVAFSGGLTGGQAVLSLVICLAVGIAMTGGVILVVRKKCPAGKQGIGGLILALVVVGIAGYFRFALWMFKWIFKLVFRVNFGGDSSSVTTYASYYTLNNGGPQFQLWTANGNYAVLKDENGNTFDVRPHGDDGLVCDDSGNLYYPM